MEVEIDYLWTTEEDFIDRLNDGFKPKIFRYKGKPGNLPPYNKGKIIMAEIYFPARTSDKEKLKIVKQEPLFVKAQSEAFNELVIELYESLNKT